jgi:hypothetical protein
VYRDDDPESSPKGKVAAPPAPWWSPPVDAERPPRATPPRPPTWPPAVDLEPSGPPPNRPAPRGKIVVGALALALVSALAGFLITYNLRSGSSQPSASAATNSRTLNRVVLQPSDVVAAQTVYLIPNGNSLNEPTLDLCNGTFPSEHERRTRLQVASLDSSGNLVLSTEAVLYTNSTATSQAFAQLRDTAKNCPPYPVTSPVGEPTVTTKINPPPDASWPQVQGVDRLAYDIVATPQQGDAEHSVVVYLRRGRLLMGVYFNEPSGQQSPVAGQTTVADIVTLFEHRMAGVASAAVSG